MRRAVVGSAGRVESRRMCRAPGRGCRLCRADAHRRRLSGAPADTPEKRAYLESLTPRKVLLRSQDGERRYVYADPTSCKCLYVGGEEQYQRFRRQEQMAVDKLLAGDDSGDAMDWRLWDIAPR